MGELNKNLIVSEIEKIYDIKISKNIYVCSIKDSNVLTYTLVDINDESVSVIEQLPIANYEMTDSRDFYEATRTYMFSNLHPINSGVGADEIRQLTTVIEFEIEGCKFHIDMNNVLFKQMYQNAMIMAIGNDAIRDFILNDITILEQLSFLSISTNTPNHYVAA